MKMVITLHPDEHKEAILYYLQEHRSDFIIQEKKPPEIKFFTNGKELDTAVAVEIEQGGEVHTGPHPYR